MENRFKKIYSQGALVSYEIWVDQETGVSYLYHASGYAGGLTPLLNHRGEVTIDPVNN